MAPKKKQQPSKASERAPLTTTAAAPASTVTAQPQYTPEELELAQKKQQEFIAATVEAMELKIAPTRVPEGIVFSTFSPSDAASLPQIMRLVEKDLSEPYSIFTYRYFVLGWPELTIMAKEGDELLGVIVCKCDRQNRRRRLRGYIAMLAVDEHQRKRGIGSYLAHQAILTMKDKFNCDEVVLETELTNLGAMSLYERLGFVRDKRLCRYYLNGGDAFRLKLWFSSPSWNEPVGTLEVEEAGEDAGIAATD